MLIFLLDMTAVTYVTGLLISEKLDSIDFTRKEVVGAAYSETVRQNLMTQLLRMPSQQAAQAFAMARIDHDAVLHTAEAAARFQRELGAASSAASPAVMQRLVSSARELLTVTGNQSNLILDPDLDSYYVMSIVTLRLPELLEALYDPVGMDATGRRTEVALLTLVGKIDAIRQGLASDYLQASAAGDPVLRASLGRQHAELVSGLDAYTGMLRKLAQTPADDGLLSASVSEQARTVSAVNAFWMAGLVDLDRLLHQRIHGLYYRMAVHLGTAMLLLAAILSLVYLVASQIARPLRGLARVAEEVRQSGDYSRRAYWSAKDEIGQLFASFNDMLAQLDHERLTQQELAASARAAQAQSELVASFPIPMVVTSVPDHEVLHVNRPAEPWIGACQRDPWRNGLEPGVRARFFQRLADRGAVDEFEVRWLSGAEPVWAVLSARQLQFQGRSALLTAFTPINVLKVMEQRLELWAKVFEASSEGIIIMNAQCQVISVNNAFCRSTGYEFYEVIGEQLTFLVDGDGPDWLLLKEKDAWQGEVHFRRQSGETYPAWLMVSAVREAGNGSAENYIGIAIDITDRKAKEERIRFLAQHDVLTELPNRALCHNRLSEALASAQQTGEQVAVLFIDLDRFKFINDTLGHHIGDGLLRTVARRLVHAVRAHDTVSRLGGDEFVIIMRHVSGREELDAIVSDRLIPAIRQNMVVDGHPLTVSCSVGVAMYPQDATSQDDLMRCADAAMYEAKAAGRDTARYFSAETDQRVLARQTMEAQLRNALTNQEFSLHFQPRLCARTRSLLGAEALLRWHNPVLGMVPPGEFIGLAEETGLIKAIGPWVLAQACKEWVGLQGTLGIQGLHLSVNLSAAQLADHQLVGQVRLALAESGLNARQLELELTESHLMDNPVFAQQQVAALKEIGVEVAIDDFGTGYSSLAYLKRFEIDKLKVDQSFVRGMLEDSADAAIVQAVIGLGHTLGLKVVAEGVENMPTAQALTDLSCDELQGYGFGRPMPGPAYVEWARTHGVGADRRQV